MTEKNAEHTARSFGVGSVAIGGAGGAGGSGGGGGGAGGSAFVVAGAGEVLNASGNRKNVGKTKWSLYLRRAWPAIEQVVRVTEFGAKKYEPDGWWKKELDESETCDAIVRHTLAVMSDVYFDKDGNVFYGQNDPESGLPHWAHAAWNCLAIGALRIKKAKALP